MAQPFNNNRFNSNNYQNNRRYPSYYNGRNNANGLSCITQEQMQSKEPFEHNGVQIYPVNEKNIKDLIQSFNPAIESNPKTNVDTSPQNNIVDVNNENHVNETIDVRSYWSQLIEDEVNGLNFYNYLLKISHNSVKNRLSQIVRDKEKNQIKVFSIYNSIYNENATYTQNNEDYNINFHIGLNYAIKEEYTAISHICNIYDIYENDSDLNEVNLNKLNNVIQRKIFQLLSLSLMQK